MRIVKTSAFASIDALCCDGRSPMLAIADCANRRTSGLGSARATLSAGNASLAGGPIPRSPMQALFRSPSSSLANNSTRAGTACAAASPMSPMSCAANARVLESGSCKAISSAGNASRMSIFDPSDFHHPPPRTPNARAALLLKLSSRLPSVRARAATPSSS